MIRANKLAILIIIASFCIGITSVWNDSPVVDEVPHIGAGFSYIDKQDFRLNPEHPPLAKDLAGIFLKLLNLDTSVYGSNFWNTDINGQWDFGRKLIFNSGNDANEISHFAKISVFIFFILSAIIIYIWTKELRGNKAALIALFLFSFSPTVIAHSRFVTTDMAALFGVLVSSYFFIKFLRMPNFKNLFIAGLVFGVAQLTKFSLFLLIPYFLFLALAYGLSYEKHRIRNSIQFIVSSIVMFIVGYVIVWSVYALHVHNYPAERQRNDAVSLIGNYKFQSLADRVIWASDKPVLRPMAQYALGFLMVTQRSLGGNTTYFLGEVRATAWKEYFPIVYFIKEPLAFWILLGGVLAYLLLVHNHKPRLRIWIHANFAQFAMLVWIALYWYTSITANLNIGIRHLLPVYGFTYILLSGPLAEIYNYAKEKSRILLIILIALFGWYLAETISVYPYYLTYFNQTVGGPSGGHRYVVDSNLDWGQDAKRLADWIKKNNIQEKVYLDFFGWSDPSFYARDKYLWLHSGQYDSVQEFLNENPQGGWIAVSATFYMNSREKPESSYAWLDPIKPVAIIGHSIFIWHIVP